jgi:ABC-type nitrate/sulfonate/bicarbonate transport system ATPase subunit
MAHAGTLEIKNLHKQYQVKGEPLPVLQDISLTFRPGEFVSIVGTSGCGKSTLLRLVIGLEADYKGEILLDGKRIVGTSLDRGIVFQEHRLFPWLDVAIGLLNAPGSESSKAKSVQEHIGLVGLAGFETAYPHQLSGGTGRWPHSSPSSTGSRPTACCRPVTAVSKRPAASAKRCCRS